MVGVCSFEASTRRLLVFSQVISVHSHQLVRARLHQGWVTRTTNWLEMALGDKLKDIRF
jgi:hypothetical protein